MKVITAIEKYKKQENDIFVFLAGGITNCEEWQVQVLNSLNKFLELENIKSDNLIVFNPRRKNFPINDPTASFEQIEWEFNYLEQCDIFSMYFDGTKQSDQPICFYELGRNIERMKQKFPGDWERRIIISGNSNFKRISDVVIQTMLASNQKLHVNVKDNSDELIELHTESILNACKFSLHFSK